MSADAITWYRTAGGRRASCSSSSAPTALWKWLGQSCTGLDAPSKLPMRRSCSFQTGAGCAGVRSCFVAGGVTTVALGVVRGVLPTLSVSSPLRWRSPSLSLGRVACRAHWSLLPPASSASAATCHSPPLSASVLASLALVSCFSLSPCRCPSSALLSLDAGLVVPSHVLSSAPV